MSLVELSEFVKAFETEFDVTAAAPVAAAAAGGAAAAGEQMQVRMSSHLFLKMQAHRRLLSSRKFAISIQASA
jgi:ribosomal protein L7/L12